MYFISAAVILLASNWIKEVNRLSRNRLPREMKHYSRTGRKNYGRPLKRLLDTWDRNGSTNGPTPWQIYDDDDDDDDDNFFKSRCWWDNLEKYGGSRQATDDNIIPSMRTACWVSKVTDTHTLTMCNTYCFPPQQWYRERASTLRYTDIASLVIVEVGCFLCGTE
jgi:hypothetical protein